MLMVLELQLPAVDIRCFYFADSISKWILIIMKIMVELSMPSIALRYAFMASDLLLSTQIGI